MLIPENLDWKKMKGLIPAIVQNAFDGRILMQGYMNEEALDKTMQSGLVTFWSRSQNKLWTKGETSGNHLQLDSIAPDCDGDCLLVMARPIGPTCHLGADTCFDGDKTSEHQLYFLAALENIIARRDEEQTEGSYTTRLLSAGPKRIAQKVGEEGVETALAGAAGDKDEVLSEASDLLYHLLVLLRSREIRLDELLATLAARHQS